MIRKHRATELRQAELTDAALHLIATRGVTALTTRALAGEVGLSSGAIFRHFPSLDALLDAVVGRVEEVLDATYPPAELPPIERLERFVQARSSAVGRQLGIMRLVLSEQFLLALPADGSARLQRCITKSRAFLRDTIAEGQRSGALRDELPPEALAAVVMGTVQVLALAAGKKSDAAHADAVRATLFTLLRKPASPRARRSR